MSERRRWRQRWRGGSCYRFNLPGILLYAIVGLGVTNRAVRVCECKLKRMHPIGLMIRSLHDPGLTAGRTSRIVSNESTDATDGKQRRDNECLSHRNRTGRTRDLQDFVMRHTHLHVIDRKFPCTGHVEVIAIDYSMKSNAPCKRDRNSIQKNLTRRS